MKKSFVRKIRSNMFGANIILVVCDIKNLEKLARNHIDQSKRNSLHEIVEKYRNDDDGYGKAFTIEYKSGTAVIWMPKFDIDSLVHEVCHAAFNLMEKRHIYLSKDTGEVYAYLIDTIFEGLRHQK